MGPVEGRIVIDREVAKLAVNMLELFSHEEMTKYYPGMSMTPDDEGSPTTQTMTSTLQIAAGDYLDVQWVGATADGKSVTIKIENAINMTNLEWGLEDKSEVVPLIDWTATFDEAARSTPPWEVVFAA